MKKYLAAVSAILAAVLLTACREKPRNESPVPVKLLYWNIQNGMWDGQTDNYERFVNFVKEQDPDICVWCEAQSIYKSLSDEQMEVKDRYLVDGWGDLAKRYGHEYWGTGGWRDSYPQVITSKYPITYVKKIVGEEPDSVVVHGAGWATVSIGSKTLNLVTLHTWPFAYAYRATDTEASKAAREGDAYRTMEIKYICDHTISSAPSGDGLWMMMGDFNAVSPKDNDRYGYAPDDSRFLVHNYILGSTPYLDIIREKHPDTFRPTNGSKNRRIDFIYCTPPLLDKVTAADVIWDSYTTPVRNPDNLSNFWHPSDHLPIAVEFEL